MQNNNSKSHPTSGNVNSRSSQSLPAQKQQHPNSQQQQQNSRGPSERKSQALNDPNAPTGRNPPKRPTNLNNPSSIKRPTEIDYHPKPSNDEFGQSREKQIEPSRNSKRETKQTPDSYQPSSNNQVSIDENATDSAGVVLRKPADDAKRSNKKKKKDKNDEEEEGKRYSLPPKLEINHDFEVDEEDVVQSSTPPTKDGFGKRRFNIKNIFGSGKRKSQKQAQTPTEEADILITEVPSSGVKFTVDDTGKPLPDSPVNEHKSRKKAGRSSGRFSFLNPFNRTRSASETRSTGGGSIISSGVTSNPPSSQPSFSVKPESSSTPTTPVVMRRPPGQNRESSRYHSQSVQHVKHMNRSTSLQHLRQPVNLVPGVCGMANPDGLTCYINSIIQCFCHVDPLSQYLATNDYSADIDRVSAKWNKEQMRDLTDAVANILRSLWRHTYRPKITELFRIVISKYKPEFATKQQQDAHEFMLFLLNTLHEESNQSRKKLYRTKSKLPSQMLSPSDVAQAAIDLSKHNQSIMYKLFTGLQQSCITCPTCRGTYRSLEPYMCLSLPIPTAQRRPVFLTHVDLKCRKTRHAFVVSVKDKVYRLKRMVSRRIHVDADRLLIVEMTPNGYGRVFTDHESMEELLEVGAEHLLTPENNSLFVVELPDPNSSNNKENDNEVTELDDNQISIILVHTEIVKLPHSDEEENGKKKHKKKRQKTYRRLLSPSVLQVDYDVDEKELVGLVADQLSYSLDCKLDKEDLDLRFLLINTPEGDCELNGNDGEPIFHNDDVEGALNLSRSEFGLPHLNILVVWNRRQRQSLLPDEILSSSEDIDLESSVTQVAMQFQMVAMLADSNPNDSLTRSQLDKVITLQDCLQLFTEKQKLSGDNKWTCPKCEVKQQATFTSNLWTTPDILVIHLKRFHRPKMVASTSSSDFHEQESQDRKSTEKIIQPVSFPLTDLDVRPYLEKANGLAIHRDSLSGIDRQNSISVPDDYLYDLMAVCCHHGKSVSSGHYTSYCRSPVDLKWRHINDTKIAQVLPEQVLRSEAYILYYQRRSSQYRSQPAPGEKHWSLTRIELPFIPQIDMSLQPTDLSASHNGAINDHIRDSVPTTPLDVADIRNSNSLPRDGLVLKHLRGSLKNNSSNSKGDSKSSAHQLPSLSNWSTSHEARLSAAAIELALASHPGATLYDEGPKRTRPRHNSMPRRELKVTEEKDEIKLKTEYHSTVHVPKLDNPDAPEGRYVWRHGEKVWVEGYLPKRRSRRNVVT